MKKGSKMKEKSAQKVSEGLKRYFQKNPQWNKGLKYAKYDQPASKRFRKNPEYYLKELESNAKRRKIKGYDTDEKRLDQIKKRKAYYQEITGAGRPARNWSKDDIKYLRENYLKSYLELCKHLGRSWGSISHKISRLGLQKYNKWTS